jgi:hypothetical protein
MRDNTGSFLHFIGKEKSNRAYIGIAIGAIIVEFTLFKLCYPFPDFFSDSFYYLYAAYAHLNINIWPIGYSKFLEVFHRLTSSDTALVAFQYFFLELTALYFFLTIRYLFRPAKNTALLLYVILFFNPLFLYLSNYINSDPLFGAISLWWFTELIWVVRRPAFYQVFTQAILVFLAFTVRHTAVAFILSRQSLWIKVIGSLTGAALMLSFVIYERQAAYKMYGASQFSPMSGWLLANNALYMYGDISVNSGDLPDGQTRDLDTMVKQFYRRVKPDFQEYLYEHSGAFFMHSPESPLRQYVGKHYKINDNYTGVVVWGKASIIYNAYARYLIRHNPIEFIRDFVFLNARKYFLPPLDRMDSYNMNSDEVDPLIAYWFHYKSIKIRAISNGLQGVVLFPVPIIFLLINLYLIGNGIWWLIRKRYREAESENRRVLYLVGSLMIVNFFFWVFVTIIVFRYEFFPMIVGMAFSVLLLEWSDKKAPSHYSESLIPIHPTI